MTLIGVTGFIVLLMFAIGATPLTREKPVQRRREYQHWGEG